MFERLNRRAGHYLLLLILTAGLYLPNLGGPSLWDIDEGNNAEAAHEMLRADNWRLPTFNYRLRVDKPALLYWLQIFAYQSCGVNEFAARLPSALAAAITVLLTYELGRRMFGATTGLLAGLLLASAVLFGAAAHFANPDALLTACTVLSFICFWHGYARAGRIYFVPVGVAMALAVLAKGPVGLLLPSAVIWLFLIWSGRWRLLLDRRLALGALAFCLVALPWYVWVGVETKFEFLRRFIGTHNVSRFLSPMEGHGGPSWYYLAALALGFTPWSVFLGPTCWYAFQGESSSSAGVSRHDQLPYRFLGCWVVVYLVFFSAARTKLPNYILPIYPALAVLTGRFLDRWRGGEVRPPAWVMSVCLSGFALLGVGTAFGFAAVGGLFPFKLPAGLPLPELRAWALLGLVPLAGAAAAAWCWHQQQYGRLIASLAAAAVLFLGPVAVWGGAVLDAHKAPRPLAQAVQDQATARDIRVACYGYFQPSLVFYCGREVSTLDNDAQALDFLRNPLQVFLVTPAAVWDGLAGKVRRLCRLIGRHRDMYRNCDVVVVTNCP
jgi:hypothetical protein